jgi:hypothetical protein
MASQVQTQGPSVRLRILSIVIWFGFLVKPNAEAYLKGVRAEDDGADQY